jgi:hypothetical protein
MVKAVLALLWVAFLAYLVWIGITKGFDEVDTPLLVGLMVAMGVTAGRLIRYRNERRRNDGRGDPPRD